MNYMVIVEVEQSLAQLVNDEGSSAFAQPLLALHNVVELTVRAQLHHNVEVLRVGEEAVLLDNVAVLDRAMHFKLARYLFHDTIFEDLLLRNNLHSTQKARVNVSAIIEYRTMLRRLVRNYPSQGAFPSGSFQVSVRPA